MKNLKDLLVEAKTSGSLADKYDLTDWEVHAQFVEELSKTQEYKTVSKAYSKISKLADASHGKTTDLMGNPLSVGDLVLTYHRGHPRLGMVVMVCPEEGKCKVWNGDPLTEVEHILRTPYISDWCNSLIKLDAKTSKILFGI